MLLDRPDSLGAAEPASRRDDGSTLTDRDVQLALWMLYELSYRGFSDVDARLEWDPAVLGLRGELERWFERDLRTLTASHVREHSELDDVAETILTMAETDGPSLASYLRRDATTEQMRDFLRERSVQQLKESDPQAFLVPRLRGSVKVALMEIQYDEFGAGRPEALHQDLYAHTLTAVGLDPAYGAYVEDVSATSLAAANAMSLLCLNRRLTAAGVGHFAAFEASSSVPSRRIAAGLERLGLADAAPYFHEHVEADAVHEQVAARDVAAGLAAQDPDSVPELLFGAACVVELDRLSTEELLRRWDVAGDEDAPPVPEGVAS
jgi:pyrroloquinoline quinone (PQQ) biosynthesis protein C